MYIVGLCGGSGSGKGAVCSLFEELGIPTIDTDGIYHKLTASESACLAELRMEFGESIIKDGALCRKALADIVFAEGAGAARLAALNSIAHRHILAEARRIISLYAAEGRRAAVVDAPLLFESGFDRECDTVVAVIANREKRIERIIARDNISYDEAQRRIDAQHSDAWLREHADVVIENNTDIDTLRAEVGSLVESILK